MKLLLLILNILPVLALAQTEILNQVEEVPYYYTVNNGFEIKFSSNEIFISKVNQNFYSEEIKGKKSLKFSHSKKFFYIAIFDFPSDKSDYQIDIKVFNDLSNLIYTYKLTAPFDLPHPIFSINDEGKIASFNPLNFKLTLFDGSEEKTISLEKEVEFEMERSSFVEMTNSDVYVLTSLKPLTIEENESNAFLYKINLNSLSIEKEIIDYSIPVSLSLIENSIILSGIKFQNMVPNGSTLKYDLELNLTASNNSASEKIIFLNGSYYSKYGKFIYKLNYNLAQNDSYELWESSKGVHSDIPSGIDGNRILDIVLYKNSIAALIEESGRVSLYMLNQNLEIEFKKSLENLDPNKFEGISEMGDKLAVYVNSRTYVYK